MPCFHYMVYHNPSIHDFHSVQLLDWCIEVTEILDKQSFEGLPTTSSEEVDGLLEEVDTLSTTPNVTKEEMEQLEQSADHCVSLEVQNSAQIALNRTREIQERIHLQKEKLRKTLEDLNTDAEKEELIKETKQVASALKDVLSSVSNQTQDGDDKQEVSPYPLSPTKMDSMQGSITVTPSHEVDKVLEDLETAVQKFQDNSEWLLISPESTGIPGAKAPDQPETPKTTLSEFIDSGKFKSMKPMIEIVSTLVCLLRVCTVVSCVCLLRVCTVVSCVCLLRVCTVVCVCLLRVCTVVSCVCLLRVCTVVSCVCLLRVCTVVCVCLLRVCTVVSCVCLLRVCTVVSCV